jgi:hemolysin D
MASPIRSVMRSAVLWAICSLFLMLSAWAVFADLDIVATSEGKLVPQTLLKVVQPAEAGVIREIAVKEGDNVRQGQLLARLDSTVSNADHASAASELAQHVLQERRLRAELSGQAFLKQEGDDPRTWARVASQYQSNRLAYINSLEQEQAQLRRVQSERASAAATLAKLQATLPAMRKTEEAYAELAKTGFISPVAARDKQREFIERSGEQDAQALAVAALDQGISAQEKRVRQIQTSWQANLHKELSDLHLRMTQLQAAVARHRYRDGLMELRAPNDGVVKELNVTGVGTVVQPGALVASLVPRGEALFAEVGIDNADVGFVHPGQDVRLKLATFPFQKYGLLAGKVVLIAADATQERPGEPAAGPPRYRARIALEAQQLLDAAGERHLLVPGMALTSEIVLGKRTVLEYLLSPLQRITHEAARER